MREPKRYYCGNGEGMFEDDKNGHWVEYSEHKAIIEELKQALRVHDVSVAKRKLCPTCGSDSLITLSDITYCMNDCCDGVKGHN